MGTSRLYELERLAVSMYSSKSIESFFNFKKFFFLSIFIFNIFKVIFNDFHILRLFYKLKIFKSSNFLYKGIIFYRKNKYKTNYLLGNLWFFKFYKYLVISIFFLFYPKIHYKKKLELKKINVKKIKNHDIKKNYKYKFNIKQNNFFKDLLTLNLNQNLYSIIFAKYKINSIKLANIMAERMEISPKSNLVNLYSSQLWSFYNEWNLIVPLYQSIKHRQLVNIVYLDLINSYKGWRHLRGLPVRNQRTWSNGWTAYRTNLFLRSFKLNSFKQLYNTLPINNLNTIYLAEQVNLLWKLQWDKEWNEAKKKRLIYVNKSKTSLKIDLTLMSNLVVNSGEKKNSSQKKKKPLFKKNVFTLGFEPGFTKTLLKTSANSKSNNSKYQINVEEKKNLKKKPKKKQTVNKIKQKKKSNSWD